MCSPKAMKALLQPIKWTIRINRHVTTGRHIKKLCSLMLWRTHSREEQVFEGLLFMWRRGKWWWEFLETWRWVRGWSHKIKVTAFFFSTVSIAGIEDRARELMPSWKAQCPYTSLLSPGIKRRREIWKFCLLAQTIGVYGEQLVLLPGIFRAESTWE